MKSEEHGFASGASKGFTLIELLVVIAIIGMLASIVLASLNSARKKARDARRMADLKQLQSALELYANDNNGVYPTGVSALDCNAAAGCPVTTGLALGSAGGLTTDYIAVLPIDPLGDTATPNRYYYRAASATAGSNTAYCLSAGLENTIPSGTPNGCGTVAPETTYTTNRYSVGS